VLNNKSYTNTLLHYKTSDPIMVDQGPGLAAVSLGSLVASGTDFPAPADEWGHQVVFDGHAYWPANFGAVYKTT